MPEKYGLSTGEVRALFAEEISALGGEVQDCLNDGTRLYARSVLPGLRDEVRPKDKVQAGVALRATGDEVRVRPYTFRLVCSNGAIRAHAVETRRIHDLGLLPADEAARAVREAVRACGTPQAFAAGVREMRSAMEREADVLLEMISMLRDLPGQDESRILIDLLEQFTNEREPTRFGLMNAITAVARETYDPELRWRLEEMGGGVPVQARPRPHCPYGATEALPVWALEEARAPA